MIKPRALRTAPTVNPGSPARVRRRLLIAGGIGMLLAASLIAPLRNASAQTTGGTAGSGKPANAGTQPPTLLILGDSLTAEYGLVRGTGWAPLLEKRLQQKNLDYRVVNSSISGETTSGGVSRLPALLKQTTPRVVIVELGSNDALRGLPLDMTQRNLSTLVSTSKAAGARVLLVGMQIPPNYGRDYTQRFKELFGKVAAEQKVALVPFLLEGVAQDIDLFQADRLHPVAKAQPQLLDNVWQKLEPLLR